MTASYDGGERRPIASRERRWSRAAAHWLVARNVSPNAISMLGMIACILAGAAMLATTAISGATERFAWLVAAVLVQARLLANMLDGMVAVQSGKASAVGELYNEIPDRISDAAALVGLGYAAGAPTLGWAATCAAIFTAYVRAQGKAAGARHEFCGPMAKPHRMFIVTLTALFMGIAPAEWRAPCGRDVAWNIASLALMMIIIGSVVTVIRRLARIVRTLRGAAA